MFGIRTRTGIGLLLLAAAMFAYGDGNTPSPQTPQPVSKPVAAVYVFEKDRGMATAGVRSGLDRINRETSVIATEFDMNTVNGDGQTPLQYRLPLEAAIGAGLPNETPAVFVVVGDDGKVRNLVKSPKTEQQVVEAVK